MKHLTSGDITGILLRWSQGDTHALDSLTPLVYKDLRRMASYLLRSERQGHTLQPTALVHEAYLKLAGQAKVQWQNRAHFLAVAARAMRQILVDHARGRKRIKRDAEIVPLEEGLCFALDRPQSLLALDEALKRMAVVDARKAQVVELRFFGGSTNEEIAEALHISANTVIRDWKLAKAWLQREMDDTKLQ